MSDSLGADELDALAAQRHDLRVGCRRLEHCDAVLRLPGASKGADQDVRIATESGLSVYSRVEDIPGVAN